MTPEVAVFPSSAQCQFSTGLDPAGRPIQCRSRATMRLEGGVPPLCDKHAELAMASACGREVRIERHYN